MIRGRQTRPSGRFRSHFVALTRNGNLDNDSQSCPAYLKQLSSKSNSEYSEKEGPDQSKHIWANAVLFCHVLRIEPSELDKGQDVTGSGIKE